LQNFIFIVGADDYSLQGGLPAADGAQFLSGLGLIAEWTLFDLAPFDFTQTFRAEKFSFSAAVEALDWEDKVKN
jgi:hypothetical protein